MPDKFKDFFNKYIKAEEQKITRLKDYAKQLSNQKKEEQKFQDLINEIYQQQKRSKQ